jgi:hypothetical protein
LRWQTPVTNVFIGGPIIGHNGTMVLCGIGNDIRAYVGDSDATSTEYVSSDPSQAISLFPNPAMDFVKIQCPTNAFHTVALVDVYGKTLIQGMMVNGELQFDVSNIPSGAYFINFEGGSAPAQEKIIIQH